MSGSMAQQQRASFAAGGALRLSRPARASSVLAVRRRVRVVQAVRADAEPKASPEKLAFAQAKPVSPLESALGGLSTAAFYGVGALMVAAGAGVGSVLAGSVSKNTLARAAGAAALGAGSAAAVVSLSGVRDKYVGKALYNSLVGASDPISTLPVAVRVPARPVRA